MNKDRHPFISKQAEESKIYQYLGSDGFPIAETYDFYLKVSDEFKVKARKYAKNNLLLKNSILHHIKCGYNSSEKLEEEVFLEREKQLTLYKNSFHSAFFDKDQNSMYECFIGKSKRIRIIRELNEEFLPESAKNFCSNYSLNTTKTEEFSDEFDNKRVSWFIRYCILSRFIQGARNIILRNRLEKALTVLRTLTLEKIQKIENEMLREKEDDKVIEELKLKE